MRGRRLAGVRPAKPADHDAVLALLRACSLPLAGVPTDLDGFFVATSNDAADGDIVGVAGVERAGDCGLLRSVAVAPDRRGQGIAAALVAAALERAAADGVWAVYLLTTTASDYFPAFGFVQAPREDAPAEIRATAEFAEACPASATMMVLQLRVEPPE